jgi:glutamate-1-semialdehyde 2,1-aminomutase
MATTGIDGGVSQLSRQIALTFRYNDLESLRLLFRDNPDEIACVILEPARTEEPVDGFLHKARALCKENGALFILDEMITGFRIDNGGGQSYYDVEPDLSAFGKAIANGFSVSALAGKQEFMELGGLYHDRERVFLLSTTHGAETHSLAAAIATMNIYQTEDVTGTLARQGQRLRNGVNQVIDHLGVGDHFTVDGLDCSLYFATKDERGEPSQPYRTLFLQELIKRQILAPSFVMSYSHTDHDIDQTIDAVSGALEVYKLALTDGIDGYLVGESVKPVYRRYN